MRVHLYFPESGSLKGKRAELNRVKALLRERLHASVAEVGHQDTWQRSTLAVAIAARSAALAQDTVDTVQRALDGRFPQGVRIEYRLASWDGPGVTRMTSRSDAPGQRGHEGGPLRRDHLRAEGPQGRIRHRDRRRDIA